MSTSAADTKAAAARSAYVAGFANRPGAVGSPPQHYGNPLGEQKALASGSAIVDLHDRAVISVTGPDRLTWLDSLTSQSLAGLLPGDGAETLLLDPTGRIEHAIRVVDDGVTAWLLVDGSEAGSLVAWLDRMRFMLRVTVALETDYATIGVLGSMELPAAAPNGVPLEWVDPWVAVAIGGYQYASVDDHPSSGWAYREVLVGWGAVVSEFAAAGTLALEALRIAAWRPRLATEGDEKAIPHEFDWLRSAVHLSKGCYRGQETVAKVHNLGHPPRRLVMLHLDGSDGTLPPVGAEVQLGDVTVGHVTSVGLHWELGPIALALIKRKVDPEATLAVVSDVRVAATQQTIVPTDAGASANVPRIPRLGAVST